MFKYNRRCCFIVIFFKFASFISGMQAKSCEKIICSYAFDPVCGAVQVPGRADTRVIEKFHNICHLTRIKCLLYPILAVRRISDSKCHIRKYLPPTRRLIDHSITGAKQACNHSCPTFCVDTYDPQCINIHYYSFLYKDHSKLRKTMINHCHVDLFSCAQGVNVSVIPLSNCYQGSNMMFQLQVAAFKGLNLLQTDSKEAKSKNIKRHPRRANDEDLLSITRKFNLQDREKQNS